MVLTAALWKVTEKIDFCKNVHRSCLLNLKWSLQICSGSRQPRSSHGLLAWMLRTYNDGVLRDKTLCFFWHKIKQRVFKNNGSNMGLVATPVRLRVKFTFQMACLQDKVSDATLCRGWVSRVKMSINRLARGGRAGDVLGRPMVLFLI